MSRSKDRPVAKSDALKRYRAKRDFSLTPEPSGGKPAKPAAKAKPLSFVVQKHWASHLHYDFRLELDGSMKSWAVPKGPSFDPHDKRLAVEVEDHPVSYSNFEGTIPAGQYGAGKVMVWDKGSWQPLGDARAGLRNGNLKFELQGHKLHGKWALVRMKGRNGKQPSWLLVKEKDGFARAAQDYSLVDELPDSVAQLPAPVSADTGATAAAAAVTAAKTRASKPRLQAAATAAAAPADGVDISKLGRKSSLPLTLTPQLATLVDVPPAEAQDWLFEIKYDGYRILIRVDGKTVRLVTRSHKDWTAKLKPLQQAVAALKLPPGWYDGEIVVNGDNGQPDFSALQASFDEGRGSNIVLYLFDMPFCAGRDLRQVPLQQRRALLQQVLGKTASARSGQVRFSAAFEEDPVSLVASACRLGLEGLIGKRRDAAYTGGRTPAWIKLKCHQRQEFVIGGYTDPQGSRTGLGALLLGFYDADGALQYAGNVGTGFNQRTLADLKRKLDGVASTISPFGKTRIAGKPHWVRPELVAEVAFQEWTSGGHVRQAVFHALRTDKPPKTIVREKAVHQLKRRASANTNSGTAIGVSKLASAAKTATAKTSKAAATAAASQRPLPADLRITHAQRVIDPKSGATKLDLVRYYNEVAELMLPHVLHRPVSVVRAPAGVSGELFFQKHLGLGKLEGVRAVNAERKAGTSAMVEVTGSTGLLSAAQWNVIEFHSLNAQAPNLAHPDRMVFDLDPGAGVRWPQVQQAAQLTQAFLAQLGLTCFLKTSGGKGLHVVVPLRRLNDWDSVKGFSQAIVEHLASTIPQRFVAKSGPRNRVGKIFIDYLRNGASATTVCAWSVRARPGLGVSVPVAWDELASLIGADHWTLATVARRLALGNQPWDGYAKAAASLGAAMKKLGYRATGVSAGARR